MTEFEAKKIIYFWSKGTEGGFMTSLVDAMCKADWENRHKLHQVYPELENAVFRFKNESNYFEDLCFEVERELGILSPEKLVNKSVELMND